MPFDALGQFLSTTSIAGATTAQTITGSVVDLKTTSPKRGYDLAFRVAAVCATLASSGSTNFSWTAIVRSADDTALATNPRTQIYEPAIVSFVNAATTAQNVTAGARVTDRVQTDHRYLRVDVIVPAGASVTTNLLEAVLGTSTPA